jgi:hypothetical protein
MKLYYPYLNLFYPEGTTDYNLEFLVKIPGNLYKKEIVQSFDGEYWEVRLNLNEKKDDLESQVKLEEYKVKLTPDNLKQLEKIKVIVKNLDNHLRNGDPDGEGQTGSGNGEIEP